MDTRKRNSQFIMADSSEVTPLLGGQSDEMSIPDQSGHRVHPMAKDTNKHPVDQITFNNDSPINRLWHGLKWIFQNVTLEPMLFLKMVAESNLVVVADSLEIDRVCLVNLNYTEDECQHMDDGNHSDVQADVQRYQNTFNYYQNLMDSILPLIVVILFGSLTDKYGRKPPMLGVLAGFVSFAVVYIVMVLNPSWPVEVLFVATFSVDIMGTWVVFNMAVYSYVADITEPESRTKRMGFLDVVWYLGNPVGRLMGGWIYHWLGYVAVFAVSAVLWTVCFFYVLLLVHESVDTTTHSPDETRYAHWGPLKHLVILFNTAFKDRPGNGRCLLLSLLGVELMVSLTQGHQMFLWARRVLKWGATEFSTWSSIDSLVHMAGTVVWLLLASKLKLHDTLIATGGLFSQGLWCITLACITGPFVWWLVIVASILGMFEETIGPAIRTMLTFVVEENEKGKVFALSGLLASAWLTVDRTIYTGLYNTFVTFFPQINLVVQAGVCVVLILGLLTILSVFRRQPPTSPSPRNVHHHTQGFDQS